jgi:hypothetical protein
MTGYRKEKMEILPFWDNERSHLKSDETVWWGWRRKRALEVARSQSSSPTPPPKPPPPPIQQHRSPNRKLTQSWKVRNRKGLSHIVSALQMLCVFNNMLVTWGYTVFNKPSSCIPNGVYVNFILIIFLSNPIRINEFSATPMSKYTHLPIL